MENFIPRKYNYTLETGVVGTDNENLANIFYNINRMESKASFFSDSREDMDDALSDVFFMITDSTVHFNRFIKEFGEKLDQTTVSGITDVLGKALDTVRFDETTDISSEMIHSAIRSVYADLLSVVQNLCLLDNQSVGKV